jgi:hypothetical protein
VLINSDQTVNGCKVLDEATILIKLLKLMQPVQALRVLLYIVMEIVSVSVSPDLRLISMSLDLRLSLETSQFKAASSLIRS